MSKVTIRVDVDFSEGELKNLTGELWNKAEQRILNVLRKYDAGSGVTKKEISQNSSHTIRGAKNREAILAQLIEEGIIEVVSEATGKTGARYAIKKQERK